MAHSQTSSATTSGAPVRAATGSRGAWLLGILMDVALVSTLILFTYAHAHHVIVERDFTSLPFALEQGVLATLTLLRRRSGRSSRRVSDWFVAGMGAWLPLTLRVDGGPAGAVEMVGLGLQLVGVTAATVCFFFLGRSFGVVAGDRGLKTRGPYSWVRHPVYASHMLTTAGFVVVNTTPFNVIMGAVIVAFTIARIRSEERFLRTTSDYTDYQQRVRWRLLPGVF